jgi:hypothetical protein
VTQFLEVDHPTVSQKHQTVAKSRDCVTLNEAQVSEMKKKRENCYSWNFDGRLLVVYQDTGVIISQLIAWPLTSVRYSHSSRSFCLFENSEPSATFASNQRLAIWTRRTQRRSDYITLRHNGLSNQLLLGLHLGQHKNQKCAQKYSTYRFAPHHSEYSFRSIPYSVRI